MLYAPTRTIEPSRVLRLGLRARLRAVREARLTSERARRRLAGDLENAIARSQDARTPFTAAIPVCREAVTDARGLLLDLAERLRAPRHANPDGVRMAHRLLVDGAGPLYVPEHPGALRVAVLRALWAMDGRGAQH
jgi:hypothetical protein